MPWDTPTKSFIRKNTDFTGSTVWQQDQQATIKIIASRHDNHDEDIAGGISACLNLDGINEMRAVLGMGGYAIQNMADGVVATDGATVGQVTAGDNALQTQISANDVELADHESRIDVIEVADPFYAQSLAISGPVNQISTEIAGSGSASMTVDTSISNRWRGINNAAATLNITAPTGPVAMNTGAPSPTSVEEYTVEGTILIENQGSAGVITLQLGGVAVSGVDILGSNPVSDNTKYLLTYVIHRLTGDVYDAIFIWSAV